MATFQELIAERRDRIQSRIGTEKDLTFDAIEQLGKLILASGRASTSSGTATSATSATSVDIADGIDSAIDIESIKNNLINLNNKSPILGQALTTSSTPVVLPSVQIAALTPLTTVATTQSGLWSVAANTGLAQPLTDTQLRAAAIATTQSGLWNVTANTGLAQPLTDTQLRAAALPLSAGASTDTLQSSIINRLAAIEAKLQSGYRAAATIQRSADITAYAANDVYGAPFQLANTGSSGGFIILNVVRIILNISTLPAGMSGFVLYLYSISPPSNAADNGAFSVPASDRGVASNPVLLTPLGIDMGIAQLAVGGGSVVLAATNINEEFKLATGSTSLWGYLVTRAAFTPAAPSETATIALLSFGV